MKCSLFALTLASTLNMVVFSPTVNAALPLPATTGWSEDFSADPLTRGWREFGDTSLFEWDAAQQRLAVTWDSRQTNSFFARSLGTVLAEDDDFRLSFDLRLDDVTVGIDTNKTSMFQIAVGLIRLAQATNAGWFRGAGMASNGPRNLIEFDYFPDSGFGATVSPTLISSNNEFAYSFNYPVELTLGDLFHVEMTYTAGNRTMVTTMTRNGEVFGPIENAVAGPGFGGFRVDHLAVCSFNDGGQDPEWDGSVLAHGTMDNISVTVPAPPVPNIRLHFAAGRLEARFTGHSNWTYTLERTLDFHGWTPASPTRRGEVTELTLQDTNSVNPRAAFYRVRADRP